MPIIRDSNTTRDFAFRDKTMTTISASQLRQIARQMEVGETPVLEKSSVIEKIKEFHQDDPLSCPRLIAPVGTLPKGFLLFRIRDYKIECPDKFGPLFFATDPKDLIQILLYREQTIKKKVKGDSEKTKKRLGSLKLDVWKATKDIKVIELNNSTKTKRKVYNYNNLEKNICAIDPKYKPGYDEIPFDEIPSGDNFIAANWLSGFGCIDGWIELPVKGSIQEVMLTPRGLANIKIIETTSAIEFIQPFLDQEEPISEPSIDISSESQ